MTELEAQGHSVAAALGKPSRFAPSKARRELLLDIFRAHKGRWFTLYELCQMVGGSQTGTSAKARDLRKMKYGAWNIVSRKKPGTKNTWEYQMP